MAEQKEETKFRATANVLTAGDKKDYFRGQVISEGEFKQLPKEIKRKFEPVEFLPILSADARQAAQTAQALQKKIAVLEGDLAKSRKEVQELKKALDEANKKQSK